MKLLTERQYAEAINEAINRFSERRDAQDYVNARLLEVEEHLRSIRSAIDEQSRRIDRLEEIFLRKPEKTKGQHVNEAVPMPFITTTGEDEL